MESQEQEIEIEYRVGQSFGRFSLRPSRPYTRPKAKTWVVFKIWVRGYPTPEGDSRQDKAKAITMQALAEGLHDLWRKLDGKDFLVETLTSHTLSEEDMNLTGERGGTSKGWGYIVTKEWIEDPSGPRIRDPNVLQSALQSLVESIQDLWNRLDKEEKSKKPSPGDFIVENGSFSKVIPRDLMKWKGERVEASQVGEEGRTREWRVGSNSNRIRGLWMELAPFQALKMDTQDWWHRVVENEQSPWNSVVEMRLFNSVGRADPMKWTGERVGANRSGGGRVTREQRVDTSAHRIYDPEVQQLAADTTERPSLGNRPVSNDSPLKPRSLLEISKYMAIKSLEGVAGRMLNFEPLNGITEGIVPPGWEDTSEAWAHDSLDAGQMQVTPILIEGAFPPKLKQYPLPLGSIEEVVKMIYILENRGYIKPNISPSNAPVWPVKKPDGTWSFSIDYRALNRVTAPLTPVVTTYQELVDKVPGSAAWFSVLNINNWFLSIPLNPTSQPKTAFTWGKQQYCWTRLPQGFLNNVAIFHQAVRDVLAELYPMVAQDKNELLCWGASEEETQKVTRLIIQKLTDAGLKLDGHKVQLVQREVSFLGIKVGPCGWRLGPINV
ncbi:uncharacterized protein LOC103170756 [Ornithorhynchus anatinus]|uniref:Reverse transcriptase domain-containing protein n=1 Tax=Ornithorhynchus anatinus TaxID=9258 RepID=K7EG97_ORNAN|nr:uncharacterized protein LOC103170756 [Ornithorhynchus anatinus]